MKKITSIIATMLLLTWMMMTMVVFSPSPTTIPARMTPSSLMNRKIKALYLQFTQGKLNKTMSSQQKDFCWLEKQWSVSCRTPLLTQWTGRNEMLTRMKEQMFFRLLKVI